MTTPITINVMPLLTISFRTSFARSSLRVRRVKSGLFRQIETKMFDIADDANDRHPMNFRIARPADTFTQRVFVLEILAHHRLVGDPDQGRLVREILWTEIAPS